MKFQVKTNSGKLDLTSHQLLEILLGEVIKKIRESEFAEIALTFSDHLQTEGNLGEITPNQLITSSFALGFYYNTFLKKNEVKVEEGEDIESLDRTTVPEPSNENSSSKSS